MQNYPIDNKSDGIKSCLFFFAMIFVIPILILSIFAFIDGIQTKIALKQYQPVIDYIEDFKSANGVYPNNIAQIQVNSQKFHYYNYETYNNQQDFIFLVSDYEYDPKWPYLGVYRYCSNKNLDGCNPELSDRFVEYNTIGDWVETHYND